MAIFDSNIFDDLDIDLDFSGIDLPGIDFSGIDLPGIDFSGIDFSDIDIPSLNLLAVLSDLADELGDVSNSLLNRLGDIDFAQLIEPGNRRLIGSVASNLLLGGPTADVLSGLAGHDTLVGALGRDLLIGGRGRDLLLGGEDNDRLKGDRGRDILDGGAGRDMAWGGSGGDFFVLNTAGQLIIRDFEESRDRLVLDEEIRMGDIALVQRGRNAVVEFGDRALAILRRTDIGEVSDRIAGSDIFD